MAISDAVMVFSVLAGPLIAVQLTRYLDNKRADHQRKLAIFKTLMSTRAYAVSAAHVEALNLIDLEFSQGSKSEKAVINAWKRYLDLLGDSVMDREQWGTRRIDLLVELLYEMATVLKYDFDKTHIKNSAYSPIAHGEFEEEHRMIRTGLIDIFKGTRVLPMHITNWPEAASDAPQSNIDSEARPIAVEDPSKKSE